MESIGVVLALWDELRARPGPFYLTMRGSSMWPFAPENSLLAISPCAVSDLRPGELVTFRNADQVITHRVVRVDGERVLAWGDTVLQADPWIAPNDVLGRAEVVTRGPLWPGALRARIGFRWALAGLVRRLRSARGGSS